MTNATIVFVLLAWFSAVFIAGRLLSQWAVDNDSYGVILPWLVLCFSGGWIVGYVIQKALR